MKSRLAALVLLAAFAFGLTAGPHPCRAAEPAAPAALPSCHAAPPPAGRELAPGGPGCCDDATGDGLLCERACHAPGLCIAGPALAAARAAARLTPAPAAHSAILFVPAIDHIPLA